MADTGGARFWRIVQGANYAALDGIPRKRIDTNLIEANADDMLRVVGSIAMGFVRPSELIRVLQGRGRSGTLARAICEIGRVSKTLHLLTYIDDESYRRQILLQINRGESRNALARDVFHGKRGELRQSYREGQEDQLGALGLVVNAIVLWNTRYIELALDHLSVSGHEVRPEDVARLSPLRHEHINFLGRYHFMLSDELQRGGLRNLVSSPHDWLQT